MRDIHRPDLNLHPRERDTFDAADEAAVKRAQQQAHRREKDNREVLATVLSTPQGRAWMWDTLAACHVFETSYQQDPCATAFREGERNMGLQLLAQVLRTDPSAMAVMMRENGDS